LLLAAVLSASGARADGPARPAQEKIETPDGRRIAGRLVGDAARGFGFVPEGSSNPLPLEKVARVLFEGVGPNPASSVPPFQLVLGFGGRISARLGSITADAVRLTEGPGGQPFGVVRAGVRAVEQRPGEAQVLQERFEALEESRWAQTGLPEIDENFQIEGKKSLRLPAGGASVTHRLPDPLGSGRFEIAYHDSGVVAAGQRFFVDLTFRGPGGPEPVQAMLGWDDDTLAVLSRGGPALAVQRLARRTGWHRLVVRFGPDRTDLAVDGDELAHGDGPGGPLAEVRLATEPEGSSVKPAGLAVHLDDMRISRLAEPSGRMEVDPTQDEARLITGDQLFGRVLSADAERIMLEVAGRPAPLPWASVAGIHFQRVSVQAEPMSGLWVTLDWRAAPGSDHRDVNHVEGVLAAVSERTLSMDVPYVGRLEIGRDRAIGLTVLGRASRLVIDPFPHHLGNLAADDLDPPQAEGGTLEIGFDLKTVPAGTAAIALDVVQVIGESGHLDFSPLVKKGELRTRALLNGRPFDDLNRHVTSRNDVPERIRLPIPGGLLRAGRNVLRLEQSGTKDDPTKLDNLGVLGVALEFAERAP
jgi:hypothetical protein